MEQEKKLLEHHKELIKDLKEKEGEASEDADKENEFNQDSEKEKKRLKKLEELQAAGR